MSVIIIGSTMLLGLSGFPEVQFTLHKEETLEHVVHSTLSMADAFTHYGIIFCHTYRMQPSCLYNSSVKLSEVLMYSYYHCLDKTSMHECSTTYSHVKRDLCAQRLIGLLPGKHPYPCSPSFWKVCFF